MDYRQILILVVCIMNYVNCSPYSIDTVMKRNRPLCGSRLKNALSLVCQGMYAGGKHKKSISDDIFNFDEYEEFDENYEDNAVRDYEFPFLRNNMIAMLPNIGTRPSKRGIVEECCRKACTEAHLQLYCLK